MSEPSIYDASMNPLDLFGEWLAEAKACPAISEPTAMTLATATPDGTPSARIVLLKALSAEGFGFYSNNQSRKGRELSDNPKAALVFYWMPLNKQVRIEGVIEPLPDAQADDYFASRGREKQLGAWASVQSTPMQARGDLEARIAEMGARFAGMSVPRPPHWSGWQVIPHTIEFWIQRDFRLHERVIFRRDGSRWAHAILYP